MTDIFFGEKPTVSRFSTYHGWAETKGASGRETTGRNEPFLAPVIFMVISDSGDSNAIGGLYKVLKDNQV